MLYILATPIGNLEDLSFRAVSILKEVDAILCEDTRQTLKLLRHFTIEKPLVPFHKFNEASKEEDLLRQLQEGRKLALVSDAGTPLISDPGANLVRKCRDAGLPLTFIPGPSAVTAALVLSGFNPVPFQFIGFLPKKVGERKACMEAIARYPGTTLCFESPNRIEKTLEEADPVFAEGKLAICREITKKFEEVSIGTPAELLKRAKEKPFKGEIVLLFSQMDEKTVDRPQAIEEHVYLLIRAGLSEKEAIKQAAKERGVSRREIYQALKVK